MTLLSEDFESATLGSSGSWTQSYFGAFNDYPYNWFTVQNGGYPITNKTMEIIYITSSQEYYGYGIQNAANTNFTPLIYHAINATGYTNIKISYDWICSGEPGPFPGKDYGQMVLYPNSNNSWFGWQ